MRSLTENLLSIRQAATILRQGGVVAVPTETVYGLAADACNPQAVARIFAVKRRPANDPLIVHILHADALATVAAACPADARTLADHFWPGPLTLVLPRQASIPDAVTAGLATVAVRVPAHPVMREILAACRCPLAAPSANRFGMISPTTAAHVYASLGSEPDGIVDGGTCAIGLESTIVGFWDGQVRLLRPGAIDAETIAHVLGKPVLPYRKAHPDDIRAPGAMSRHYAPRTPLVIAGAEPERAIRGKRARIVFGRHVPARQADEMTRNLSPGGDLEEAARTLYGTLRELDALGLDGIVAELVPDEGIGIAVNDRLRRAATPVAAREPTA